MPVLPKDSPRIELPKDGFCCPLCRSKEYERIERSSGIMGPVSGSWTVGFSCSGCSVMFGDPEKFSKKKK